MSAVRKVSGIASSITVGIMFLVMKFGIPYLAELSTLIESIRGSAHISGLVHTIIAILATAAIYRSVAAVIVSSVDRFGFFKRYIFGNAYIEGTWVGKFTRADGAVQTVEHFEQGLDGIVIRGWGINENGTLFAQWRSIAVSVESKQGLLTYTYGCDVLQSKTSFQGIGSFQFMRENDRMPPFRITGYSTDLTDGIRTENDEVKLSDQFIVWNEAIEKI